MKHALRFFALLIALLAVTASGKDRAEKDALKAQKLAAKAAVSGGESAANAEPPTKSEGFDVFKNVRLKNIFDPSRRGLRSEGTASTQLSSAATSRGRSLALTGTMVADGRQLAFFGGSAADGGRVIPLGNSVASYKVTAIAPTQVSLEHEGKTFVLDVGTQISFDGGSSAPGAAAPVVEAAPEATADTTGAPSVPGVAGDKADILRRMMERRAKETGK